MGQIRGETKDKERIKISKRGERNFFIQRETAKNIFGEKQCMRVYKNSTDPQKWESQNMDQKFRTNFYPEKLSNSEFSAIPPGFAITLRSLTRDCDGSDAAAVERSEFG